MTFQRIIACPLSFVSSLIIPNSLNTSRAINAEGKALVEQKGFNKEEALKEFMDYVHSYLGDDECDQIMKAFTLADKAHEGQFRASGEPYIMHPLADYM